MEFSLSLIFGSVVCLVIIIIGLLLMLRFFVKVEQGKALIVNTMRSEPIVTFTGRIVLPVIHKSEVMDISLKTIEIDRRGRDGLICKDNIRADIKVTFFVRVNKTVEDVLKVAQAIGCSRASDQRTLEELFIAKFSEALKTVGKQLEFEDLYKERDSFRDKIIELIGTHLNGYVLEDAAIDYLEQTPLSDLDPQNIMDSQGIRKITELTAAQNVQTNQFKNQERMTITKQNVEAKEAILELERQEADAEARQAREVQNIKDQEKAEIETVASQERLKSEQARIETDEKVQVREANRQREVEVAEQNRLRIVSIEAERVKLAQEQERINREREVELQEIAKQRDLEEQKREIALVVRERIVVEKTVAEEEERIKELRIVAEADREKQALIIHAEAQAQEALVIDIKKAEAAHEASKYEAMQQVAMAEAERDAADKLAAAKIRLAEGLQAEAAATGLAQVKVKEANALVTEKEGLAKIRVQEAEVEMIERRGLAEVQVKEANMLVTEKEGLAQIRVQEAEVEMIERRGLAEVQVKEADATAVEKLLIAEATGLAEKFKSLDALSEGGRRHEEFRLQLEQELKIRQATLETQQAVAAHQAKVLADGLKNARIDIVGGESMFIDRLLNSISMAQSADRFVERSNTTQTVMKEYLSGDASLLRDLRSALSQSAVSAEDLKNLTVSALIAKIMINSSTDQQQKLGTLLKWLEDQGIGDLKLTS